MRRQIRELGRRSKRAIEYGLARIPGVKRVYWRYAPVYYRWKLREQIGHDTPLDPIRVLSVNPDQIIRFTGRTDAAGYRYQDLGTVMEGEWDTQPTQLIEDTVIYRSFVDRYRRDQPWEETELFAKLLSGDLTKVDMNTESAETLREELERYDDLYQMLQQTQYKTQQELRRETGIRFDNRVGLLDRLTDEITVDVGRDGELLFVDGRHRLCLAKLLGLSTIPAVVLVRHAEWLPKREAALNNGTHEHRDHPDIAPYLRST
ncbi:ParB N-terminal domain-containing protein [Halorubrum pallidum]|uniref:ParB/Sulfiredoxin domain-containing protein n=1 Tax=Halorubrum pallidum TaxID=1526114 RepID=A0ABD5T284_9EURY